MAFILVIDDEEDTREQVQEILELDDHQVAASADLIEASQVMAKQRPDLILLDINMPWMRGDKMLSDLKTIISPPPKIVFYSGMDGDELKKLTIEYKVTGYIQKGADIDTMNRMVGEFLQA